LERLLENRALCVREWYLPIAISWLDSAARTSGEVRLIIDTTKVSFAHQKLMVALAFQRRAIPIAWTWRRGAKGHSSARLQIALLAYVRRLLPKDVPVLLVGDSEFEAGALQAQLEAWGWGYVLRQKPNNQVHRAEEPSWQAFRDLVTRAPQSVWVRGARLTRKHARQVNLLAHWAEGEKEPWLLATNLPTRYAALRAYRRRMWLDELFGDLKGHVLDVIDDGASHLVKAVGHAGLTPEVVVAVAGGAPVIGSAGQPAQDVPRIGHAVAVGVAGDEDGREGRSRDVQIVIQLESASRILANEKNTFRQDLLAWRRRAQLSGAERCGARPAPRAE
jgi:hypothetical protein